MADASVQHATLVIANRLETRRDTGRFVLEPAVSFDTSASIDPQSSPHQLARSRLQIQHNPQQRESRWNGRIAFVTTGQLQSIPRKQGMRLLR